jgi:hypothetical protein
MNYISKSKVMLFFLSLSFFFWACPNKNKFVKKAKADVSWAVVACACNPICDQEDLGSRPAPV